MGADPETRSWGKWLIWEVIPRYTGREMREGRRRASSFLTVKVLYDLCDAERLGSRGTVRNMLFQVPTREGQLRSSSPNSPPGIA